MQGTDPSFSTLKASCFFYSMVWCQGPSVCMISHCPAVWYISSLSSFIMITQPEGSELMVTATGTHSRDGLCNSKREMEGVDITPSTIYLSDWMSWNEYEEWDMSLRSPRSVTVSVHLSPYEHPATGSAVSAKKQMYSSYKGVPRHKPTCLYLVPVWINGNLSRQWKGKKIQIRVFKKGYECIQCGRNKIL